MVNNHHYDIHRENGSEVIMAVYNCVIYNVVTSSKYTETQEKISPTLGKATFSHCTK